MNMYCTIIITKNPLALFSLDQYKGCYWHVCRILR